MRLATFFACLTLVSASTRARADDETTQTDAPAEPVVAPPGFAAPPPGRARVTLEWSSVVFTGTASAFPSLFATSPIRVTSWASAPSVRVDLGDVVFGAAVPFTYVSRAEPGTSDDQAELGNASLTALGDVRLGREHRLLVGGLVALPTATDPPCICATSGSFLGVVAREFAWGTSFRHPESWAPQSLSVVPSLEYQLGVEGFLFRVVGTLPVVLPTARFGGALQRGMVELMTTLDVSAAVRILDIADVGVSFLAWAVPSGPSAYVDLGQTALSFFARTDPAWSSPIGGGAELIVDLDASWGPTGSSGRYWGLRLWLQARFDV